MATQQTTKRKTPKVQDQTRSNGKDTSSSDTGSVLKAYGYVRVSGKGQVNGDGFRRQEQAIREYAQANGIELVHVYREEGVSGTTDETDREAFQAMMVDILKNGVRTIIVEGLDRLAREFRVQEQLVVFLASKGVALFAARTGENVIEAMTQDPMRKAMVQMQGIFAELEKSLLVKKLRAARERKREAEGKCEGRKSILEVNPELLELIRAARRKRRGKKPATYAVIAATLNDLGHKTLSGKPFTGTNVQTIVQRYGLK